MRKKRVVIYDDEAMILHVLKLFFQSLDYEVFTYPRPRICPVYEDLSRCRNKQLCCDVLITDYRMPNMSGLQLLERQKGMGCKLDIRNKALMSGFMDGAMVEGARQLGCGCFEKPVRLDELSSWLDSCEDRMDLTTELADRRMHERLPSGKEIWFSVDDGMAAVRGTMVNISSCGFCVSSPAVLNRGQIIHLADTTSAASGRAEVRWTDATANGCLAGLHSC